MAKTPKPVEEKPVGKKPASIWANYRYNIDEIINELTKHYGSSCVTGYHGGINTKDRTEAIERLQNGDLTFLVANPQTAAFGLTLTAATTQIFYSNNYRLELRAQAEDRSHRIGQRNVVTYIDLVARGTVDEKILEALRKKIDLAAAIQQDGPQPWVV